MRVVDAASYEELIDDSSIQEPTGAEDGVALILSICPRIIPRVRQGSRAVDTELDVGLEHDLG